MHRRVTRIRSAYRPARRVPGRALLFGLLLAPGTLPAEPADACRADGAVTPVCLFERPEDLEPLQEPGGLVLVSEYGALDGTRAGRISLYDVHAGTVAPLYPPRAPSGPVPVAPAAGERACPGPPGQAFSPHGIHLGRDGSGRPWLLVVNHGGREAVEIFDVDIDAAGVKLAWRDCVVAPEATWMNDVVTLPGGGFAVSHMIARHATRDAIHAAEQSRADTGEVRAWFPATGWAPVPGTAGALPNGVAASADGSTLYVNYYFGDTVAAIDRASGARLWETHVDAPDNLSRTAAGELLVAAHDADLAAVEACNTHAGPVCPMPYSILALDPDSGARTNIHAGGGDTFGGATVAVEVGDELLLGSFAGNRLARIAR